MESFSALPPRTSVQLPDIAAGPTSKMSVDLCAVLNIRPSMQKPYVQLAALARDLPVPMRMLVSHPPCILCKLICSVRY